MRFLVFPALLLMIASQNPVPSRGESSQLPQTQAQPSQHPTNADQRGTEQAPLVIKQLPTPKTEEESVQEAKDREDKTANDRNLVKFTFWLVIATGFLGLMALIQAVVFGLQARRLRQTVEAAADQSQAMERSIGEASRLASAMEETAKGISASTKVGMESVAIGTERSAQQMRAYVCVEVGTAFYQDRATDTKFAGQPAMLNTGNTPAHKVGFRAKAAVLPAPLPEDFAFPLPGETVGGAVLGPQQRMTMLAVVDEVFADNEVNPIRTASSGKALYIWGIISYEDVFKQPHTTRFCQILYWLLDGSAHGKVFGIYIDRHNDAT